LTLLGRARANDGEAWVELVRLYRPLILFWCRRAGIDGQGAEDLSQEVFAAASHALSGFRHDRPGDTFRGWLRAITRNQIARHRRRPGPAPAVGGSEALLRLNEVPDPQPDPLAGCEQEEETEFSQVVHRALERVRPDFEKSSWQAFWLTVVGGQATADAARVLGLTEDAVRQARSRVLRRLKQEVGELPE
jgi:RNA polymerase sigma-70 factor (ECF subfamily)